MNSKENAIEDLQTLSKMLETVFGFIATESPCESTYPHLPIVESDSDIALLHSKLFTESPTNLIVTIEFVENLRGRISRYRQKYEREMGQHIVPYWRDLHILVVNTGIHLRNYVQDFFGGGRTLPLPK